MHFSTPRSPTLTALLRSQQDSALCAHEPLMELIHIAAGLANKVGGKRMDQLVNVEMDPHLFSQQVVERFYNSAQCLRDAASCVRAPLMESSRTAAELASKVEGQGMDQRAKADMLQ